MGIVHGDGPYPRPSGQLIAQEIHARCRRHEDDRHLWHVEEQVTVEIQPSARGNDLDGMTRLAEGIAETNELGMPD
jgi:hypothetical protein